MSRGNYQIPFGKKGDQLHYPEEFWEGPIKWVDNFEFDDVLTYDTYLRGRSAAYFQFVRSNGKKVTMFLKDFEEAIRHLDKGMLAGRFTFTKRGQNYGVRMITK